MLGTRETTRSAGRASVTVRFRSSFRVIISRPHGSQRREPGNPALRAVQAEGARVAEFVPDDVRAAARGGEFVNLQPGRCVVGLLTRDSTAREQSKVRVDAGDGTRPAGPEEDLPCTTSTRRSVHSLPVKPPRSHSSCIIRHFCSSNRGLPAIWGDVYDDTPRSYRG